MGQPIQRIPKTDTDPRRRAADRAMLLERIAIGLAHEGKNPLHNMVLHLQLMAEKLVAPSIQGSPIEKHVAALRDGIGRVDHLLKAFGEFAAPEHLPADVGAAVSRAEQLLAYEARRAGVHVQHRGPPALLVRSDSRYRCPATFSTRQIPGAISRPCQNRPRHWPSDRASASDVRTSKSPASRVRHYRD